MIKRFYCTLSIFSLIIELFICPTNLPYKTFPSWCMFFFSYNTYFVNYGFALYILMNSMFENNYPTNGNNSSPVFVVCNANTPHPMYGSGYTLSPKLLLSYLHLIPLAILILSSNRLIRNEFSSLQLIGILS